MADNVWLFPGTGRGFAVKAIKKRAMPHDQLNAEVAILKRCNHPFVIKLYAFMESDLEFYLVIDLVQGCDLMRLIQREGMLNLHAIRFYAANVVEALDYLHNNCIAHRDIKPENVMIGPDGYLRLIDFGCAKVRSFLH